MIEETSPPQAAPEPGSHAAEPARRRSSWIRGVVEVVVVAAVLYGVVWTCIQTVKVDGRSMVNTLQNGDFLIASKISYALGSPQRGDIVILSPPPYCDQSPQPAACQDQPNSQLDYIKRVIGIPGDTVKVDSNQTPTALLIQPGGKGPWQKVTEPYLPEDWSQINGCCTADGSQVDVSTPFTVPAKTYFVLGDNRNESHDSRDFGVIPRDKILAKAIVRIWPLDRLGGLGPGPTLVSAPGLTAGLLVWLRRRRGRSRQRALPVWPNRMSPTPPTQP